MPFQSVLGGSSLFVLLTLADLREFYDLDRRILNDYVVAELAQRVEAEELGITCGFADRYVPLFGGIAYIDYRGKLEQGEIGEEPYATYERLGGMVQELPLVMASTGLEGDSQIGDGAVIADSMTLRGSTIQQGLSFRVN